MVLMHAISKGLLGYDKKGYLSFAKGVVQNVHS